MTDEEKQEIQELQSQPQQPDAAMVLAQAEQTKSNADVQTAKNDETRLMIDAGKLIAEGNPKKLKTDYIKHKILEIECEKPVDAMELLKNQDFVIDTSIFGNNIHLSVNNKYTVEKQITTFLEEQNSIVVKRIDEIIPTLEDVFINLLETNKKNIA